MNKIGLIIEREYLSRVYKKSFIIMTLLIPVMILFISLVPLLLSKVKDTKLKEVAVIDETGLYGSLLQGDDTYRLVTVNGRGETPLEYFKSDGEGLYAILVISGNLLENPKQLTLFSEKTVTPGLKLMIAGQLNEYLSEQKIESYDVPGLKKMIAESRVRVHIDTVKWSENGSETNSNSDLATGMGFFLTLLIYFFVFVYGSMVLNGVVQEKTSRIVEVLISSVKPFELMMGKIIGIALVGLTQFVIWLAMAGSALILFTVIKGINVSDLSQTAMMANGGNELFFKIMEMKNTLNIPYLASCFLIYFMGGYLIYASIFAAIGSVVDQETDAQQFVMPVSLIILFAFYAAIYSIQNPDGPLAFWCSMIPLTSPIVMMVRLPFDVPLWQLLLSITLLFSGFIGSTYLASKIYKTGILLYGKKVTWKDMIKFLRY